MLKRLWRVAQTQPRPYRKLPLFPAIGGEDVKFHLEKVISYKIIGPDDPALNLLHDELQRHVEWKTELLIIPQAAYRLPPATSRRAAAR